MIFDYETMFCDDLSLASGASLPATILSTNPIDLRANGTDPLGASLPTNPATGEPVEVLVQFTEAVVAAAGAATVTINLVESDTAALGSPTVLATTGALAKTLCVPGYQAKIGRLIPSNITKRYIGLTIVVATAETTAGKITAGIISDRDRHLT
jgi:hypothetical protein